MESTCAREVVPQVMCLGDRLFEHEAETAGGGLGAPVFGGKLFIEMAGRSQMWPETLYRGLDARGCTGAGVRGIMSRPGYSTFARRKCDGGWIEAGSNDNGRRNASPRLQLAPLPAVL